MDKKIDDDVTLSSLHSHYPQHALMHMSHLSDDRKHLDKHKDHVAHSNDNGGHSQSKSKRKKQKDVITANLSGTKYEVIRQMVQDFGFSVSKDDDRTAYLIWNDAFVSTERIFDLKPYQRINHFPGMAEVTRKDGLARNMMKMAKVMPDEFKYVPRTWILPSDFTILQNYMKDLKAHKKVKTFIVKPSNGAQGHGISLCNNVEKISNQEHLIVQEYLDKPLLLDGYKFDLRIYVLITSCDPLRVLLFSDGLIRMSTEKYLPPSDTNLDHLYMHLTNYSINKHNKLYEKGVSVDAGSKRSIKSFNDYLRRNDYDVALLWRNINDMIVKTLLMAEPHVLHAYKMCRPGAALGSDSVCFELLGFDILIDRKMRPWLLEINRSPSFATDEKIDYDIKSAVIEDTLRLLNIKMIDKKNNLTTQKLEAQRRLYRPIKPISESADIYEQDRKKQSLEQRKDELRDMLRCIKKAGNREEFESKNRGRFIRIFPTDNKMHQEHYIHILETAFATFMAGRSSSMQKEIQFWYNNKLKESDILDMIAECEADENLGKMQTDGKSKGTANLIMGIPSSNAMQGTDKENKDEASEFMSPPGSPFQRRGSHVQKSRPSSVTSRISSKTPSFIYSLPDSDFYKASHSDCLVIGELSRQAAGQKLINLNKSIVDETLLATMIREHDKELVLMTLHALNDMRIKFPGKSDQEADFILDQLFENWKFHKPRIASYWLIKLDSIKKRKVIDIVCSNVCAALQRIWHVSDVESLPLYRVFSRVFNRLLWSHGQGLWSCFSTSGNQSSWEIIFSKSSNTIDETTLNCCRRIVQLCKDCLLIVYQFSVESKSASTSDGDSKENKTPNAYRSDSRSVPMPPNYKSHSQQYSKH